MADYKVTIELDVFDQPTPLQAAIDTWFKAAEWPQLTVSGQAFDLEPLVGVWNGMRMARIVHQFGLVQVEVEAVNVLRANGSRLPVDVEGGAYTCVSLYLRLGATTDGQKLLAAHFQDFTGPSAYEDAVAQAMHMAQCLCVPWVPMPSLKLAGVPMMIRGVDCG